MNLPTREGLFHLDLDPLGATYWIGGPFSGRDSSFFLFLEAPSSEKELKSLIQDLHLSRWPQGSDERTTRENFEDLNYVISGAAQIGFDL